MSKLLCGSVAAALLGLATLTGTADAAHPPRGHVNHVVHGGRAYYHNHGNRFSGGYYYRGFNHNHWSRRVWDSRYRRWHYWDPYYNSYYYWYAPGNCYYPITYAP
jgi:hypothetical protein